MIQYFPKPYEFSGGNIIMEKLNYICIIMKQKMI